MSYLGIDLGTSGLRALLLAEDGSVLGSAEHCCTSEHKHPGGANRTPPNGSRR
jgi:xylulokinase